MDASEEQRQSELRISKSDKVHIKPASDWQNMTDEEKQEYSDAFAKMVRQED